MPNPNPTAIMKTDMLSARIALFTRTSFGIATRSAYRLNPQLVPDTVRSCSLMGIFHYEESAVVRVSDPNLTAVVRRRRVGALGRFNRAKQAGLPAGGDSDDG